MKDLNYGWGCLFVTKFVMIIVVRNLSNFPNWFCGHGDALRTWHVAEMDATGSDWSYARLMPTSCWHLLAVDVRTSNTQFGKPTAIICNKIKMAYCLDTYVTTKWGGVPTEAPTKVLTRVPSKVPTIVPNSL